jgi:hypothetical protein
LLLTNDHDPKPLYYQLQAESTGQFSWDYLEQGPERWQVRIGRTGAPATAELSAAAAATANAGRAPVAAMKTLPPRARLLLALLAVASLVCGVLSGLARLGLPMPDLIERLTWPARRADDRRFLRHRDRLRARGRTGRLWPFAAPLFSGLAGLALIAGVPLPLAPVLSCLAALVMSAACADVCLRQRAAHHVTLAVAAVAWLAGNVIWLLDGSVVTAVPLWTVFLLLTIAGERLELSRFLPTPPVARVLFAIIATAMLAGAATALVSESAGLKLLPRRRWRWRCGCRASTSPVTTDRGLTRYMAAASVRLRVAGGCRGTRRRRRTANGSAAA